MNIYRNKYTENLHNNRKIKENGNRKKPNNSKLLHSTVCGINLTTKDHNNNKGSSRDKNNLKSNNIINKNRSMTIPYMVYKSTIRVKNRRKAIFNNNNLTKGYTNYYFNNTNEHKKIRNNNNHNNKHNNNSYNTKEKNISKVYNNPIIWV